MVAKFLDFSNFLSYNFFFTWPLYIEKNLPVLFCIACHFQISISWSLKYSGSSSISCLVFAYEFSSNIVSVECRFFSLKRVHVILFIIGSSIEQPYHPLPLCQRNLSLPPFPSWATNKATPCLYLQRLAFSSFTPLHLKPRFSEYLFSVILTHVCFHTFASQPRLFTGNKYLLERIQFYTLKGRIAIFPCSFLFSTHFLFSLYFSLSICSIITLTR